MIDMHQSLRAPKGKAVTSFSSEVPQQLQKSNGLRIRAGIAHHFIGIWVVVVDDRAFVRSWSVKPGGWYDTFLAEPSGAIRIGKREIQIITKTVTDKRVLDTIDRAYLDKYNTPGAIKCARDLGSPQSRAATLELIPIP
jgi:hypothetical protein